MSRPRLAVEAARTLSERIPAPPAQVRTFYLDPHNLILVHPLMVSVRKLRDRRVGDGHTDRYRIRDRIPLGPITLPISYRADMRVSAQGEVTAVARQFPGVRLHSRVSFEPADDGTTVVELLRIRAPIPLAPLTVREAVDAHTQMLTAMRRHFGG